MVPAKALPCLTQKEVERFKALVAQRGECLVWVGELKRETAAAKNRSKWGSGHGAGSSGYGRFSVYRGGKRRRLLAHRVAWQLEHGSTPVNMRVDHYVCGNKACVNVEHLRLLGDAEHCRVSARARFSGAAPAGACSL